jgi:LPXTG-site transpeptidase (sortase) family protein
VRPRVVALVAAVATGTVGCSTSASVVLATGPHPAAETAAVAPRTAAPPTTSPPAATSAVASSPTTTAATTAPTTIASHAAQLDQLPAPAIAVPVAVTAGDDTIAGPVIPAGVKADTGELDLPTEAKVVAWYQYGPPPGEAGSAVLAGHVDWHGVPGIFFKLRDLRAGDAVTVTMSDGSVQAWAVTDVTLIAKPELPVAEVFSRTGPPTLTLVTCGGSFDYSTHHYRSNVVVTAIPA